LAPRSAACAGATLLRDIVTAAGFDTAGLGDAHAQIVAARSGLRWRFPATHPADSCGIAVLDNHPERHRLLALRLWRAIQAWHHRFQAPFRPLRAPLGSFHTLLGSLGTQFGADGLGFLRGYRALSVLSALE